MVRGAFIAEYYPKQQHDEHQPLFSVSSAIDPLLEFDGDMSKTVEKLEPSRSLPLGIGELGKKSGASLP